MAETPQSIRVRGALIAQDHDFVRGVRVLSGIERIVLLGSLATDTTRPKDADVLASIADSASLPELARLGCQLKDRAQGFNSGTDVFLASAKGQYLAVCAPIAPAILARHVAGRCGQRAHLRDVSHVDPLARDHRVAPGGACLHDHQCGGNSDEWT